MKIDTYLFVAGKLVHLQHEWANIIIKEMALSFRRVPCVQRNDKGNVRYGCYTFLGWRKLPKRHLSKQFRMRLLLEGVTL